MPKKANASPALEQLQRLAHAPADQAKLAIEVLERDRDARAVRAALDVLKQHPTPAARPALLERYDYYAADGVRRDAGTYLRSAILHALRPIAQPEDLPLLERAARTYEFLPPGRFEEGSMLRSAAIVVMNEVDGLLASYHCVRLLADPYTSRLSGEPALTAIRVLAAQDNRWPLYYYALYFYYHPGQPTEPVSEVLSECLKSLAGLPASLVPGLIERYQDSADEVVLVGLADLVLEYPAEAFAAEFVRHVLQRTQSLPVYRYLAARLVNSHHPPLVAELARLAGEETDARKVAVLREVLALASGEPELQSALAQLEKRLGGPAVRQRKARLKE